MIKDLLEVMSSGSVDRALATRLVLNPNLETKYKRCLVSANLREMRQEGIKAAEWTSMIETQRGNNVTIKSTINQQCLGK